MGPPGHHGGTVSQGLGAQRPDHRVKRFEQHIAGLHRAPGLRGVDDVGRSQPLMDVPAGRSDLLGDTGDERDHVVADRSFDLVDGYYQRLAEKAG